MEYTRAIVNELGEVVAWCKDLTQEQIDLKKAQNAKSLV